MLKKLKHLVQTILAVPWIRKPLIRVNILVLGIASSHRILSVLYHFLTFFMFAREQHATLRGRYEYYRNLNRLTASKTQLRRNTHRLEKALVMQPRRDIFALDYIGETVEFYKQAVEQCQSNPDSLDISELEWAHDVLREYFNAIKGSEFTNRLKAEFQALDFKSAETATIKAPFARGKHVKPPVSYDDLMKLAMRRRSVRWFLQKPVPRELIDKALLIGRQSPTACNRLPYEFKVYDDPELVKKVAGLPFGAAGYSHNIPTIIVVVGKLNSYFSLRDRHVIYVDASLAVMAFMFALETLGLASSPINWPDFEPLEAKMQKTLGLGVDERPIMLIAVGYADPKGRIPYSQKKSLEVLRSYNEIKN